MNRSDHIPSAYSADDDHRRELDDMFPRERNLDLGALEAEAAYFDELQRQRDAERATRASRRPQDDVLDYQDELEARNHAAIDQAWREHTAPSSAELQRRVDRLERQRKDHREAHRQLHIEFQDEVEGLRARIDDLQRQLVQQEKNHHELCNAMHEVLQKLGMETPEPEDEDDIPY